MGNPSISVQEFRHGLFRVCWNLDCRDMPDLFKKKSSFQLCGSRSSYSYTISCDVERSSKRVATNSREKSKCFLANFLLREKTQLQGQKAGSSSNPRNTLEAKSLQRPVYVWISQHGDEIHLKESSNTGAWARDCVLRSEPIFVTVWMDFGTTTPGEKNIMCGLAELFHNQHRCDVQFQFTDGQKIGAHVLLLSISSPVFAAMFRSGFKETETRKVAINEIEFEVFRQLLIYLYTGHAPKLAEENITQSLFEAADKYDVEPLKEECIDVLLLRKLTVKNAINMLVWSHLHSIPKLFDLAVNFVAENGKEIFVLSDWLDLIKNYPELCQIATQRIAGLVTHSKPSLPYTQYSSKFTSSSSTQRKPPPLMSLFFMS